MGYRTLSAVAVFAILVAAVTATSKARANGRFPAASQLVVMPGNPKVMTLRTTFGILFTSDQGQNWDWICEKAVGYGGVEDPSLGLMSNGTAIAGTFEGLAVSPDTGCSWSFVGGGLAKQVIIDVVVRPDTPSTGLALTSTYAGDGGLVLFNSQLYRSTDNGATWNAYGTPIDPTVLTETVEVAASDPHRVYVSGVRGEGSTMTAWLFESTDDGTTWTPHSIPIESDAAMPERGAYIAGVDPTTADRVYVRTAGMSTSRLLVTTDAGATFTTAYSGGTMLGFVLSQDGSTVYLGGPMDGLQVASSSSLTFSQRSTIQVQCLAMSGSTLLACSNEVSGFIVGASQDQGMTWSPLLHLSSIRGPLACPPNSSSAQCDPAWAPLAEQLGIGFDAGGGGPDGGGNPTTPPSSTKSGCGCTAGSAAGGAGAFALAGLGLATMIARRRRARRG